MVFFITHIFYVSGCGRGGDASLGVVTKYLLSCCTVSIYLEASTVTFTMPLEGQWSGGLGSEMIHSLAVSIGGTRQPI